MAQGDWWDFSNYNNGLGTYGSYTNPAGETVGLDKSAFDSVSGTQHGGSLTQSGSSGLGVLGTGASILQGLGSLAGAYTGYKSLGLAEDQFDFSKAAANRDIANQGQTINNSIQNASDVGLALGGGAMSPEQIAAEKAAVQTRFVDTSAIG